MVVKGLHTMTVVTRIIEIDMKLGRLGRNGI